MNGESKILFVALDCPNATTHVLSNFLPRIKQSALTHSFLHLKTGNVVVKNCKLSDVFLSLCLNVNFCHTPRKCARNIKRGYFSLRFEVRGYAYFRPAYRQSPASCQSESPSLCCG
jgi:hypothetical protein